MKPKRDLSILIRRSLGAFKHALVRGEAGSKTIFFNRCFCRIKSIAIELGSRQSALMHRIDCCGKFAQSRIDRKCTLVDVVYLRLRLPPLRLQTFRKIHLLRRDNLSIDLEERLLENIKKGQSDCSAIKIMSEFYDFVLRLFLSG